MKRTIGYMLCILMAGICCMGCREDGEALSLEQALEQQAVLGTASGTVPGAVQTDASGYPDSVWVHICGEVAVPGVYEVESGSRVYDVLMAAGGFTTEADGRAVNLAQEVSDGMQVVIPSMEEAAGRIGAQDGQGLLNINTATVKELCTLPGIGAARAADIIAYREKHGSFQAREDIMKVSGIKTSVYEKIKDRITTGK